MGPLPVSTRFDASALIGRDAASVAEDYSSDPTGPIGQMLVAEHRAVRDMMELRARRFAPTGARAIAIELIPGAVMLCPDVETADVLLEMTRDWISAMGNPLSFAKKVAARREDGDLADDARLLLGFETELLVALDVFDETRIIATMRWRGMPEILLGVVALDDEGGSIENAPAPELVA